MNHSYRFIFITVLLTVYGNSEARASSLVRNQVREALDAAATESDSRFPIGYQETEERRRKSVTALQKMPAPDQTEAVSLLAALLKSKSYKERRNGATVLGQLGPAAKPAERELLEALKTPDLTVQTQVAQALIRLTSDSPTPILTEVLGPHLLQELKSSDYKRRLHGLVTLSLLSNTASPLTPSVLVMLRDPEAKVRAAAAQTLGSERNSYNISAPALLPLLKDHEIWVQEAAIHSLGRMGPFGKPAIPAFLAMLRTDSPGLREAARTALGELREQTATFLPSLIRMLNDPDPALRTQAAEVIARLGDLAKPALPAVTQAVSDRDPDTQRNVLWAISALGQSAQGALAPLQIQLKQGDGYSRKCAAEALGRMPPASLVPSIPALLEALEDKDPEVQAAVAQVIADLGPQGRPAFDRLNQLLRDSRADSRRLAAHALARQGANATPAIPRLAEIARADPDPETRVAAIQALSSLQAPSTELLIELSKSSDSRIRLASLQALQNYGITAIQALPEMMLAFKDPSPAVREAAVGFVGNLGVQAAPALPGLLLLLRDKDLSVTRRVIATIRSLGPSIGNSLSVILALLTDPSAGETPRLNAIKALCRLEKYAAPSVRDLASLVKNRAEPKRLRSHAAFALKIIGGYPPDLDSQIIELLKADRESFEALDF